MRSATLPSFWETYKGLDKSFRKRARKAFLYGNKIPSIHLCTSNVLTFKKISGLYGFHLDIGLSVFGRTIP
jgi:hypothetical protein